MMRRHACYGDDVEDLEMMAMFFEHMQASRVGVGTALNLKTQNNYKTCKTYTTLVKLI